MMQLGLSIALTMQQSGGGGAPSAPVVVIAPSIIAQPLVGVPVEMDEGLVTGATSTTYQWYRGAPPTTPISGAIAAGYAPVDADYSLTLYRRTTYTNAAGSTVVDVAAPAIVGKTYSEDWSGYTVGNTWTQLDTLYNRNNTGMDPSVVADANGPSGKAVRVSCNSNNTRVMWRADAATFGVAYAAETTRSQALILYKHIGATTGTYLLRFVATSLDWGGPGITVENNTARLEIDTDVVGNNAGTFVKTLVPGSYYWVRLEISGTALAAKMWLNTEQEPSGWVTRTNSIVIDPPAPAFGSRYSVSLPANQIDALYWSGGYNTDAPFYGGFTPPPALVAETMEYSAPTSGTTASYFNGEILFTAEDV